MSSVKREWGWGDVVPSLCLGVFIFFVFWPHFSEKQGESCTPVIAMALVKGLRKPETFFLSFFFFFFSVAFTKDEFCDEGSQRCRREKESERSLER